MRLGIDFGTTRTVVAMHDRGNYPLVSFRDERGSWAEWVPSRIAARGGELYFGHEAEALRGHEDVWHLSSVKRLLGTLPPDAPIDVPGIGGVAVVELLGGFFRALRAALDEAGASDAVEAMISVPANANSNQRFVTLEAFRAAGFDVVGLLNEPSAAGVEYAHRYLKKPEAPKTKEYIAVYDLGGGTFDAATIRIAGMRHEVVSSEGVERLGGDDFDRVLFEMAIERLALDETLSPVEVMRLLDECRDRKEGLNPNTRRILVEGGGGEAVVDVAEYYERCAPLVDKTVACLDDLLARLPESDESGLPRSVATVYLVGGSASFPLVARVLKERYGRRVQRSPYPHGAVAIGLAVASNPDEHYFVRETLTRHFGVWREADRGNRVVFDPIFAKDTALGKEPLTAERRYHPAHNLGHFRFLECGMLGADGEPASDLTPWGAIAFPFAPELQGRLDLATCPVERVAPREERVVVERYSCDENGIVSVTLREESTGYEETHTLASER